MERAQKPKILMHDDWLVWMILGEMWAETANESISISWSNEIAAKYVRICNVKGGIFPASVLISIFNSQYKHITILW